MSKQTEKRKIEYIAIDALKEYERNTRTHDAEQVEQLKRSITEFGFTNPVLIDENNVIIAGHGRRSAARELGMKEVPCLRLTGLTESQVKALRIADNQLALNAGWDEEMLRVELADLKTEDFDLDLLGFSMDELEKFSQGRDYGHMQELLANGLNDKKADITPDTFGVTFNFPMKQKQAITEYIEAKGKAHFVDMIVRGAVKHGG